LDKSVPYLFVLIDTKVSHVSSDIRYQKKILR